jgi:hypothetical protein
MIFKTEIIVACASAKEFAIISGMSVIRIP